MNNFFVACGRKLFFLRGYSWGKRILRGLAYPFIAWFFFLSRFKGAKYFAIKGSFNRSDWVFGLSDIDLVVVFPQKISAEKRRRVTKHLQWWQTLFPFIGDIDYYRDEDFLLWQVLGGVKAIQSGDWKWIGKIPPPRKYLYHPLKFRLNIIQELGFLQEWFEYNYFHTEQNEYRIQALSRVLKKILLNIDWLVESKTFYPSIKEIEEKYPHLWKKISAVESKDQVLQCYLIICKFFYLEINVLLDSIPKEIKDEFKISTSRETKFDLENIYFRHYWVLLKSSGYFNPDVLIRFAEYADDPFAQTMMLGIVYCRLIEGFGFEDELNNPYLDTLKSDIKRHPLYSEINSIAKSVSYLGVTPIPLKSEIALITSTWGNSESHLKALVESHCEWRKQESKFVHIHIQMTDDTNLFQFPVDIYAYHIKSNELNNGLWHKEALQNIGGYLARFQKILIFIDSDVYSENPSYLSLMSEKLKTTNMDLIQGFSLVKDTIDEGYKQKSWVSQYKRGIKYWRAPGLIWGMNREIFLELRGLNSLAPEGSNDGAFVSELLGIDFGHAATLSWFKESLRQLPRKYNLDYLDEEVVHINHGQPRDYINRTFFLELLKLPLRSYLAQDFLGILKWREQDSDGGLVLNLHKFYDTHPLHQFVDHFQHLLGRNVCQIKAPFKHFCPMSEPTEIEFFYLNYGFISFLRNACYQILIPVQSSANVDLIFKTQYFTLKPGDVLSGEIKIDTDKIHVLKIMVEDTRFGRTFRDNRGTQGQTSQVEIKNHLDCEMTIQLHLFLRSPSAMSFQVDLTGLRIETSSYSAPSAPFSVNQEFVISDDMISYYCKDQSSSWSTLGNGFDIQVISPTTVFYQHNIRIDLTTLPVQHGQLSFELEASFDIELQLFIEDKEGYCFLLTDCTYYKFSPGTHSIQFHFSWEGKVSFPNLYILFRCGDSGSAKFRDFKLNF